MAPVSRLGQQIAEVAAALAGANVPFALIGGLALASYKVVRATQDIDLLVDLDNADIVEQKLAALGYHRLHRSADAGNYSRALLRANRHSLNMADVREYFRLFQREALLNELLDEST
jgi:hypothetical protein